MAIAEIDYMDMLPKCGGRLCPDDAALIHRCAMEIEAKTMLEIGVASGCSVSGSGSRTATVSLWGDGARSTAGSAAVGRTDELAASGTGAEASGRGCRARTVWLALASAV